MYKFYFTQYKRNPSAILSHLPYENLWSEQMDELNMRAPDFYSGNAYFVHHEQIALAPSPYKYSIKLTCTSKAPIFAPLISIEL